MAEANVVPWADGVWDRRRAIPDRRWRKGRHRRPTTACHHPTSSAGTQTVEKGHGSIAVRQVCRIERTRENDGDIIRHPADWAGMSCSASPKSLVREGLRRIMFPAFRRNLPENVSVTTSPTSFTILPPEQADPDALLALWRDHRLIENRPHWRQDVILRGHHGSIRSGPIPRAMAALRTALLDIVRDAAEPLPEIPEIFAENRLKAIAVLQRGVL